MWIASRVGFFSVVSAERGRMQVRARHRDDLASLQQFAGLRSRITATPHADYPFRLFVPVATWMRVATKLAKDAAGYTNFKAAVAEQDPERAAIYGRVWSVLRDIERRDQLTR